MNLKDLLLPFPPEDIEWRVSRSGRSNGKIYCNVLCYITNRAIMKRLDDVCGPENWRNEMPKFCELRPGVTAVVCGISIRLDSGEWLTKWDVAEPTNIEAAKGGFSGAMKRAGAQFGIGRYLYQLTEAFAEVSESGGKGWNYAKLPKDGGSFYWKPPKLPAWALPLDPGCEIKETELNKLKYEWKSKFAPDIKNPSELIDGFTRFVHSVCGEFPVSDHTNWLRDSYDKCMKRIKDTTDPQGPSADVPFGG